MGNGHCALFRILVMATDDDGFKVVRRKGRHVRHSKAHQPPRARTELHVSSLRTEDILIRVEGYRKCLEKQQFCHQINDLLGKLDLCFSVVVCYGIGHIGSCSIAQQQFALLLLILKELKPPQCCLYDPVLVEEERRAIEQSGCTLFTKNEMCKYTISQPTLFYMPHCGSSMYNNLLWANWDPTLLSQIAIIGNRFSSYHERLPQQHFKKSLYLYRIFKSCVEHPLPNSYDDITVFNDLALHAFPLDALTTLPKDTWSDRPEPIVDPHDLEIISTPI